MISKKRATGQAPLDTAWISAVKKLEIKEAQNDQPEYAERNEDDGYAYQYDRTKNSYDYLSKGELFYFDPNTISDEGWKKLGLRDKTITTIQNYLNKGGHFYKPEDLQKIYGLRKDEYERLSPYIRIETATAVKSTEAVVTPESQNENQAGKSFTSRYSVIDINEADTSAFISLPGIGSKLAARIINFREKLGGFYSVDQVAETYGLPDSTFQKVKQWLKLDNISVKKININTATVDQLKAHPYIKYSIANPIVAYRTEHGPFTKVEDIKKVMVVTGEIYKKIAPYLIIE
jgi:competence ComEA-like helix-hairpin-helix protein